MRGPTKPAAHGKPGGPHQSPIPDPTTAKSELVISDLAVAKVESGIRQHLRRRMTGVGNAGAERPLRGSCAAPAKGGHCLSRRAVANFAAFASGRNVREADIRRISLNDRYADKAAVRCKKALRQPTNDRYEDSVRTSA